jgi:hypothetical protein
VSFRPLYHDLYELDAVGLGLYEMFYQGRSSLTWLTLLRGQIAPRREVAEIALAALEEELSDDLTQEPQEF